MFLETCRSLLCWLHWSRLFTLAFFRQVLCTMFLLSRVAFPPFEGFVSSCPF